MVYGGGAWVRGTALLTADGKYILVAAASAVRLYSSATGALVTSLNGHKGEVTAVVLDHASNDKIYSASLDGTVKHWDYASGQLLQSFTVNHPIESMMLFFDLTEGCLAPYSLRLYQPSKYAVSPSGRFVATFFMKTVFIYSTERPALPPLKLYHTREITCVTIDPSEERIAAGDITGRILIWNGFKEQVPKLHKASPVAIPVPMPSAAVANTALQTRSPANSDSDSESGCSEDARPGSASGQQQQAQSQLGSSEAAGEAGTVSASVGSSGKSVQDQFAKLQRCRASVPVTTVHWHAHPVGALCFSADGTLLLSGGEEAVLVVWQLDSSHRTFLPRLGGPLTCITRSPVDAACYVISQADNTVRMVNTAALKVEVSIHGMRPPPRTVTALESTSAAVLAPGGGELVMPTDNSMLQFWDAARDRHVDRLQVAPRNTVSLTQQDHALQGGVYDMPLEPHVSHVAFSSSGSVMATVDVRPNAGSLGSDEQSLRFWDRSQGGVTLGSQEQPIYSMNTYLDDPHRGGSITSLAYHPSRNLAATTGSSGDIKIWVQQAESKKGRAAHWRCQSVGTHTGGAMSAAAFSCDGSLLAAASGDQVTLWDPYSNAMISCLASPPANQGSPLRKLCFIGNSPYLVGYTTGANPSLIVWNLITESVWWSYQLAVSAVAADPMGGSIAVAVPPGTGVAKAQGGENSESSKGTPQQAESDAISEAKVSSPTSNMLRQGAMTVDRPDTHQSAAASAVFLFCAATGQPRLSWSLGQSTAAAMLFVLPGTKLHASSVAVTPDGLTPLMIVLEDRRYAIARSASCLQDASLQAGAVEQGQEPSDFEAAFGMAAVPQPAQQGSDPAGFQSEVQSRLQTLFDAPSHVLPSLKDLAPMFFDSFIEHSRKPL